MILIEFENGLRMAIEPMHLSNICEVVLNEWQDEKNVPGLELTFINGNHMIVPDRNRTLMDFVLKNRDEFLGDDKIITLR